MFTFKPSKFAFTLATFALLGSACFAEKNFDFKGTINFSNSSQNLVGQELEYSFTLLSDVPAFSYEPLPGWRENDFLASSVLLKVNGTAYALPDDFIGAIAYQNDFGDEFGFVAGQRYTGLANPQQVEFGFFSTSPANVDSNYLPLPTLPVSNFNGLIRILDDTYGVDGNYYQGLADATVTSYTVTGSPLSPVPEPATYGAMGAVSLLGLVAASVVSRY